MTPISKNIGVLGAGQLGRMMAIAGYPLGQKFGFVGNSHEEPSAMLGHMYTDADSVASLLDFADVITYESENTSVELIEEISKTTSVYPGVKSLYYSQHRGREKTLFNELGIATALFKVINSESELVKAIEQIGLPAVLKTTTEGYDGKGQFVIRKPEEVEEAWVAMDGAEAILEGWVSFNRELSLVAVRAVGGETVFYPLVENHHVDGILRTTYAPAPDLSAELQTEAESMVQAVMDKLEHVGVLTVELFDTDQGLVVNEMAPRVHNSGHWTQMGARTCQFENHVRAISGLPLGSTEMIAPVSAMINLIGDVGDVVSVLKDSDAELHLYDKSARVGRKLGHVNIVADSEVELKQRLADLSGFVGIYF